MAESKTSLIHRQVIWTKTAARQRSSILKYWVGHNKSNTYSLKLLEMSNAKVEAIAKNPEFYRKTNFPDTRVASMDHYSICYKYNSNQIIVTAFWDNRQDPGKLIQLLKEFKD